MKKIFLNLLVIVSVLLPSISLAQSSGIDTGYLTSSFASINYLLGLLVKLLIALAVAYFIWNVIKYSMSSDPKDKDLAKDQMIRGIIALTVIVSIWGIVAIVQRIFGLNDVGGGAPTDLELRGMIPGA